VTAEALLSRLDRATRTGDGRWLARCPAHDDGRPSLSIRQLDDGRLLVYCFAGCSANDVVSSVGLELHNLFPPRALTPTRIHGERMPHIGADVLRALAPEIVLIVLQGGAVARGDALPDADRQRALLAAQRVLGALDAAIPHEDRRAVYREAVRIADEDLAEAVA
jgi:hypothetical protein